MKKLMLVLASLLVLTSLPMPVQAEPPETCNTFKITEIGANLTDQFIELINCSSVEQSLAGYALTAQYNTKTTSHTFSSELYILPGGYYTLLLSDSVGLQLTKNPSIDRQVQLLDPSGLAIDSVSYNSQKTNKSWSLTNGVWQSMDPTPGQANLISGPPVDEVPIPPDEPINLDCEALKIVEIGANPDGKQYDQQFVELTNQADQPISVKDCRLMTNRSTSKYFSFGNETLDVGELRTILIADTELTLSKTVAGTVYIISSDGLTEFDAVEYPTLAAGTSWWLLDQVWQVSKQPSPGIINQNPPVNHCDGVKLSEIGANVDDQFIELVNVSDQPVNLSGCQLMTNRSATNYFAFEDETLAPGAFRVVKLADTTLTLTKTTSGTVYFYSSDGELEIDSVGYADLAQGTSWSIIDGSWAQTHAATPGLVNIYQEYPTCQDGYYRNLETGRCNKIVVATGPATCPAGQYRNQATNRCRKLETASTLTPCKEGQERNLETNRCRKIAATVLTLKPCADGYERNTETNRCRKIVETAAAQFAVDPGPPSNTSQHLMVAALGVLAATTVILLFQYRMELGQLIRKFRTQFLTVR